MFVFYGKETSLSGLKKPRGNKNFKKIKAEQKEKTKQRFKKKDQIVKETAPVIPPFVHKSSS